jgi:hypothetical protein
MSPEQVLIRRLTRLPRGSATLARAVLTDLLIATVCLGARTLTGQDGFYAAENEYPV